MLGFGRYRTVLNKADGGAEGNRTPDLLIANEALYQLSYSPALQAPGYAEWAAASQAKQATLRPRVSKARVRRAPGDSTLLIANALYGIIEELLNLYWWVVILAAVMSNLIAFGVVDTRNRLVWTISDFLYRLTEPALRRIRRVVPSLGGIDLSPLLLLLAIYLAKAVIAQLYVSAIQPLFY